MVEQKEKIIPFAIQFQEIIPKKDAVKIEGRYNSETQMWEWPKDPNNPSIVMSFPQTERPPTTCIRPTQIAKGHWKTDWVVDD